MRGASGALGGNKLVDPFAQVLQNEVLIRGRLAVVDFLSPLLEWQLDAERLVDGERDIEEIEAVDLEIVDRMAFRLNVFTRNVASFRNDFSHFIKRRGHQARSLCNGTNSRRKRRSEQPDRPSGPLRSNAPYSEGRGKFNGGSPGRSGLSVVVTGLLSLCGG